MEKKSFLVTPVILSERVRKITLPLMTWLGQKGAALGIDPDTITILGLIFMIVAAWLVAQGQFLIAGIVLILGAPMDALDGAIARTIKRGDHFGALLDSTVDRFGDGFLFFGIAYYFAEHGQLVELSLTFLAWIGAFCVPYVSARAESLGFGSIKAGLFDRLVRMVVIILTFLTGWIVPGILILAVGTNITALQRLWIVHQKARAH